MNMYILGEASIYARGPYRRHVLGGAGEQSGRRSRIPPRS